MVSYVMYLFVITGFVLVLILIVVDNGLVHNIANYSRENYPVLILIVVDNGLVLLIIIKDN